MKRDLLVFTAPPASGKTHLIESLIVDLGQVPLVICPLRALADECINKWQERCLVMTPEEWLNKKSTSNIVIFDEFHLNFYWGDSFRPRMWECFYEAVEKADLVILMTATLTPEMIQEIKYYENHFDEMIWLNCGNQKLKNLPAKYFKIPDAKWIKQNIRYLKPEVGVGLLFCNYRQEVATWEKFLNDAGFSTWSCRGGETKEFTKKVQTASPPDFIIATTVLSHGVNLPAITRVIFTYQVQNLDFWIQMVARGGRRGQSFDVYSPENPTGIRWNRFTNLLAILQLNLRMKMKISLMVFQEWFLKA